MEEISLLGVTIQTDLKWNLQVERMITRASRRMYILCVLKKNGVPLHDLVLIYKMYIRPILEFASPVWTSSLTVSQTNEIERVQKRAIRFMTYPNIMPYERELDNLGLPSLLDRRNDITCELRWESSEVISPSWYSPSNASKCNAVWSLPTELREARYPSLQNSEI